MVQRHLRGAVQWNRAATALAPRTAGLGVLLLAGLAAAQPPKVADANAAGVKPPSAAPASRPATGSELLLFADVPMVVSASRTEQPTNWLSVPVSVITADDIHYSGLTNIPEILQFSPGMDVLRVDRNRYIVGVRGLHEVWSDRTLLLVNGRSAERPIFGGMDFLRQPVMMEDIKRIEVVRGPAGAAWGANALTGTINVITKDPEECRGFLASTTWNQFGDSFNMLRWADVKGDWSWRISAGYESYKSSEDAIHDDHFTSSDFGRNWRFDSEFVNKPSKNVKHSFGVGYSYLTAGDINFMDFTKNGLASGNSVLHSIRPFARTDWTGADDVTGYVQWSGLCDYTEYPSLIGGLAIQNASSLFRVGRVADGREVEVQLTGDQVHHRDQVAA